MESSGVPQEFQITVKEEGRLHKKCEKWRGWFYGMILMTMAGFLPSLFFWKNLIKNQQRPVIIAWASILTALLLTLYGFLRARKKHKVIESKLNQLCKTCHPSPST